MKTTHQANLDETHHILHQNPRLVKAPLGEGDRGHQPERKEGRCEKAWTPEEEVVSIVGP